MFIEGMVVAFSGSCENSDLRDRLRHQGWLVCDGAVVERRRYPRLFRVIGETYGAGDGSTTFKLPDYRGIFLRGLGGPGTVDEGRHLGERQECAVQDHKHKFGNRNSNTLGNNHAVWLASNEQTSNINFFETSETLGAATETRPVNLAVNYLIRCDTELL